VDRRRARVRPPAGFSVNRSTEYSAQKINPACGNDRRTGRYDRGSTCRIP
jgi:hypothetical protein